MGIINLYQTEWDWTSPVDARSRIIINGLSPTVQFMKELRFKKANIEFTCAICKKRKPKKTRYLGDNYDKICSDCSEEWMNNSINKLEEIKTFIENEKIKLKKNKEEWKLYMLVGGIEG